MSRNPPSFTASEAANRLGVSIKALRLYEQHGLMDPGRTAAGWRTYGTADMARAAEIVALRALGLSLAQVGRVLDGDSASIEAALATHQATLEHDIRRLAGSVEKLRALRRDLTDGRTLRPLEFSVAFTLPWPWGGEEFELDDIKPLTYIVGPLGSGKTRLARRLAETIPGAVFLGLERRAPDRIAAPVDAALAWLVGEGATASATLMALIAGLQTDGASAVIVDMVEHGLDQATQAALIAYLRQHSAARGRPLFLLTRSTAILDLSAMGANEAILFCPANHSPPLRVAAYPGAPGIEAVASCLASPEVRARTEGVIAFLPRARA